MLVVGPMDRVLDHVEAQLLGTQQQVDVEGPTGLRHQSNQPGDRRAAKALGATLGIAVAEPKQRADRSRKDPAEGDFDSALRPRDRASGEAPRAHDSVVMLELLEQLKQRLGRRGAVRVGEHNIVATRGMKATQDGTAFTDPLADFQHRDLVALARRFGGYARRAVFTAVGDNDDLEALSVAATERLIVQLQRLRQPALFVMRRNDQCKSRQLPGCRVVGLNGREYRRRSVQPQVCWSWIPLQVVPIEEP